MEDYNQKVAAANVSDEDEEIVQDLEDIIIRTDEDKAMFETYLKTLRASPWWRMLMWSIKKRMKTLDDNIHTDFSWNRKTLSYSIDELEKVEYNMWKAVLEMPDDLLAQIEVIVQKVQSQSLTYKE